ncbi:MAG TPA: ATP-dependent helicase [Planctomycetota bacterium]|nr:ATP-dependent helicase [Planctomycetota bacterium]
MKTIERTPAQREAIETDHPLVLVLAGPGSGKTSTTVDRIKRLLDSGVAHERIAAITFTNAGARELDERLRPPPLSAMSASLAEVVAGPEGVRRMNQGAALGYSGTLHGFCLRMLKAHGGSLGYGSRLSIVSPESAESLLASKAATLGCKMTLKDLLALKAKGRPARGARLSVAETVVATYYDELREAGILDFDVMLAEAAALFADPKVAAAIGAEFDYLFVDECQDSAPLDWSIYAALRIPNKFFVGDPDQMIFGFRGASLDGILALWRNAAAKVIKLEDNFRSHSEICEAAQRLIERNKNRVSKVTTSVKGPGGYVSLKGILEGSSIYANEGEEIGMVAREIKAMCGAQSDGDPVPSIAVLARTNAIASAFARTLAAVSIPVVARERSDLPRDWAYARAAVELLVDPENDTLAEFYLAALYAKKGATPANAQSMAHSARRAATAVGRSLNDANLHFGRFRKASEALSALADLGVSRESQMLAAERYKDLPRPVDASVIDLALALAATRDGSKDPAGDGVHVLTIHGAKGREFDVVFLVGFEDEQIPGRAKSEAAIEEERRLAYVAATRARKFLFVSWAESRVSPWGAIQPCKPSRFLAEMAK